MIRSDLRVDDNDKEIGIRELCASVIALIENGV